MVVAALVACGAPVAVWSVDDLAAPGPHPVRTWEDSVTYAGSAGERTLPLHGWGPSDVADPPRAVFSHGHQGFGANSSFLMAHLASHGWDVVAPDHVGNTTVDGPDRETEIYLQRPEDVSAVIDAVGGPVVLLGHSFGGYTALAVAGARYDEAALACPDPTTPFCATMTPAWADRLRAGFADDRVTAVIAMAPGDYPLFGAGLAEVGPPVLLMGGSLDPGDRDAIWAALDGAEDVRVELAGAGHQAFTDFADVLEDQDLDRDETLRIVDVYALAWALRAGGDAGVDGVLAGTDGVSAAVTVTAR